MALAGCGSKSSSISDILKKSEDAARPSFPCGRKYNSFTSIPPMDRYRAEPGNQISGSNIHVQEVVFGSDRSRKEPRQRQAVQQDLSGQQVGGGERNPQPSTSMPGRHQPVHQPGEQLPEPGKLPNETVAGYDCYHFRFQLSAENVKNMVSQVPQESLANNNGGTVDLWIDVHNYYMIKSEGGLR